MVSKLGDSLKFSSRTKIALWLALVAVGVCGRLWQPAYNVTPFAAIGLAAGSLFGISISAAAVPIVALVLSNMALPGYGSTECHPAALPPVHYSLEKPDSVGLLLADLYVRGHGGGACPAGTVGELTVRGLGKAQLFDGYEDEAPPEDECASAHTRGPTTRDAPPNHCARALFAASTAQVIWAASMATAGCS